MKFISFERRLNSVSSGSIQTLGTTLVPTMAPELTAAEANRRYYEQIAANYDETECCIARDSERAKLRGTLVIALQMLGDNPRALDACGGSGNVSELLFESGVETVLVDLSPEMTARWRHKAEARGYRPEIHLIEIERFLEEDARTWDLIVFSSALHHLENYQEVATTAAGKLATGGVLVTVFDPIRVGTAGSFLRRVDWVLWGLRHDLGRMPGIIAGWLRRLFGREGSEAGIGGRAELYAVIGINDLVLADALRSCGLHVVEHRREYAARHGFIRGAFRLMRRPASFSLIARRS